ARVAPVDFESTASTVPPPRPGARSTSGPHSRTSAGAMAPEQLVILAALDGARQPAGPRPSATSGKGGQSADPASEVLRPGVPLPPSRAGAGAVPSGGC